MSEKKKERSWEAKLRTSTRQLQKKAAEVDDAISMADQIENNYLLSLRIEERKAARKDAEVDEIIKNGTPEEKALYRLRDFDKTRGSGNSSYTTEQTNQLHHNYDNPEDKAAFLNYLKLYLDLQKYTDKLLGVVKTYEVEVALLSRLVDKHNALRKDIETFDLIRGYAMIVQGNNGTSAVHVFKDNTAPAHQTSDITALMQKFSNTLAEKYKDDGVKFKLSLAPNAASLTADINGKDGLHKRIVEQAKQAEINLSYVKAYIEPVEEYLTENYYSDYAPSQLLRNINNIKKQVFSKSLMALDCHISCINDKRMKGGAVTEAQEYEAVVPDYREVAPDKEVKDSCYLYLKNLRNEPPRFF